MSIYLFVFACALVVLCLAYTNYVKADCVQQLEKAVADKQAALKDLEEAKMIRKEIQKDLDFQKRLKVENDSLLIDIRNASEQLKVDIRRMARH